MPLLEELQDKGIMNAMTYDLPDYDWQAISLGSIQLTPEQIGQAIALSQGSFNPSQRWQVYLQALALSGIEQWLQERAPQLALNLLGNPQQAASYDERLSSLSYVRIGAFTVCLLSSGNITDVEVPVHRRLLDTPLFTPNFWVVVEVMEELEQIEVYGYLRHHEMPPQGINDQTAASDSNLYFPLNWFQPDPNALLLELECLASEGLSVAIAPTETTAERLPITPSTLLTPVINIWQQLQQQLVDLEQGVLWMLTPILNPEPALAFRDHTEFEILSNILEQQEIEIPDSLQGIYRDFVWNSELLRLHVLAWELEPDAPLHPTADSPRYWTLLLSLSPPLNTLLPIGLRLTVRDQQQVLFDQTVTEDSSTAYLSARVEGEWDEHFWVTIETPEGVLLELPLTFSPQPA